MPRVRSEDCATYGGIRDARGANPEAVAARQDGVHRLALQRPEIRVAPDAMQHLAQGRVVGADYDFLV